MDKFSSARSLLKAKAEARMTMEDKTKKQGKAAKAALLGFMKVGQMRPETLHKYTVK